VPAYTPLSTVELVEELPKSPVELRNRLHDRMRSRADGTLL
jgi:hypothetical protein